MNKCIALAGQVLRNGQEEMKRQLDVQLVLHLHVLNCVFW